MENSLDQDNLVCRHPDFYNYQLELWHRVEDALEKVEEPDEEIEKDKDDDGYTYNKEEDTDY
jgi:hypothetical protein